MKRAIVLLAILTATCRTTVPPTNPYAGSAEAAAAGAKLFRAHCAACHGAAAEGRRTAPALKTLNRSDVELFTILTNGNLRRGMPSWSRLPDERRWQIVAYLRTL